MGLLAMEAFQTVANQGREGKQTREEQPRNNMATLGQGRCSSPRDACVCACYVISVVFDSETLWTVARQAPLSRGSSRQEYWSGLPFPPPGDLLNPGIEHMSPAARALQAGSLPLSHLGSSPLRDIQNNFFEHLTELKLPINGKC